jgi:hypothetical protein
MLDVGEEYRKIVAAVKDKSVKELQIIEILKGYEDAFIEKLLKHESHDEDGDKEILICEVARNKRSRVVRFLLQHGADPYQYDIGEDASVVDWAKDGRLDVMSVLVELHNKGSIKLEDRDLFCFEDILSTPEDEIIIKSKPYVVKSALKGINPDRAHKKVRFQSDECPSPTSIGGEPTRSASSTIPHSNIEIPTQGPVDLERRLNDRCSSRNKAIGSLGWGMLTLGGGITAYASLSTSNTTILGFLISGSAPAVTAKIAMVIGIVCLYFSYKDAPDHNQYI